MALSGREAINKAFEALQRFGSQTEGEGSTLAKGVQALILGAGGAFLFGVVDVGLRFINAIATAVITPLTTLGQVVADVLVGIWGGAADFIGESWAVAQPYLSDFGILAPVMAILVVLGVGRIMIEYLQSRDTGDTFVGLPVDLPFFGVREEEEETN